MMAMDGREMAHGGRGLKGRRTAGGNSVASSTSTAATMSCEEGRRRNMHLTERALEAG